MALGNDKDQLRNKEFSQKHLGQLAVKPSFAKSSQRFDYIKLESAVLEPAADGLLQLILC